MADYPEPVDAEPCALDGYNYWNQMPATVDGMLGGFAQVSRLDLRTSWSSIRHLFSKNTSDADSPLLARALDCGAGIGRVTAGLLTKVSKCVDLVEPVEKFAACCTSIEDPAVAARIGDVFVAGLQDWTPPADRQYNLIWHQWCLGHLTDEQLVAWLRRCAVALAEGGWIVVKENLSTDREGRDMFDKEDSTVTRTDQSFGQLFGEAGLKCVRSELQTGFPKMLLPVRTYSLRPT